ncbi:response regulator [Larkinella terrae]|uniref:Response regulator n=1 Tax=Larkinella terrae TaxID=2025311 RepID=A0A7K0EJE7_9BACT|nr:response regulator [Larkinella terrae]MRS61651.1 response regulator [Larkinella terrae]
MFTGPIIIIEDDEDDQFILEEIIRELNVPNPIRFFANGEQVLEYLLASLEQPFIILCDINMPLMSGLELRRAIDENETLRRKAIPFIFLSTDASPQLVNQAYETTIQGFFKKAVVYQQTKEQLHWIIGYWRHCVHPHIWN